MDKAVFLDRDGVINRLIVDGYVTTWDEFIFNEGVIEAIKELNEAGFKVIIVTNQSGINRGIMTEQSLLDIHSRMVEEVEKAGAHIDGIYYCPHAPHEACGCRKPETGLFDQVNTDFEIDYSESWFIGDFESDRGVANKMGLKFKLAKGDGGLRRVVGEILAI